ncbi:efflux RND transporter periplasmic adaptor subunit [Gymnodinialimonas sp.]
MNLKPLLIIPPLAIGVLGFFWMTQGDNAPAAPVEEATLAVRTMTVVAQPLTISATGYGRVEAVQSWSAVSQVEGNVTATIPDLAVGTVVDAGQVLVQVDTTDYELGVAIAEANVAAAQASLAELDRQEENTQGLLAVEQRILELVAADFDRIQTLSENGTVTASTLEDAQRSLLAQENAVINLTNTLALLPSQRETAGATLRVREAELADAQRSLSNTTITAPFRGRIANASVEVGNFIRVGADVLTLEAIDEAEVVGAFQPQGFGNLMRLAVGPQLQDMTSVDATRVVEYMQEGGVSAYLELEFGGNTVRYPAEVVRFRGSIDNETGTLGIAVRVADPLVASAADNAPPLEFGSFVSVVLEATPDSDVIAVPRSILQQGAEGQPYLFTADAEDRLAITPVRPGPVAGDQILIVEGLTDGTRILLSSPRPSIPGLALDVISGDGATQ